jgi:hypothetical protein
MVSHSHPTESNIDHGNGDAHENTEDDWKDIPTQWIHEYSVLDSMYLHKLREPMTSLDVYYVFIDLDHSIQHIEIEQERIHPLEYDSNLNTPTFGIQAERLAQMIHNKKTKFFHSSPPSLSPSTDPSKKQDEITSPPSYKHVKKYTLAHCLLFHVDIEPEKIPDFLQQDWESPSSSSPFLHEIHSLSSNLVVPPSLFIFENVNSLYVILQETAPRGRLPKTLRVAGKQNRITKKVRFV